MGHPVRAWECQTPAPLAHHQTQTQCSGMPSGTPRQTRIQPPAASRHQTQSRCSQARSVATGRQRQIPSQAPPPAAMRQASPRQMQSRTQVPPSPQTVAQYCRRQSQRQAQHSEPTLQRQILTTAERTAHQSTPQKASRTPHPTPAWPGLAATHQRQIRRRWHPPAPECPPQTASRTPHPTPAWPALAAVATHQRQIRRRWHPPAPECQWTLRTAAVRPRCPAATMHRRPTTQKGWTRVRLASALWQYQAPQTRLTDSAWPQTTAAAAVRIPRQTAESKWRQTHHFEHQKQAVSQPLQRPVAPDQLRQMRQVDSSSHQTRAAQSLRPRKQASQSLTHQMPAWSHRTRPRTQAERRTTSPHVLCVDT
eukprot:Opistho-1_new@6928